MTDVAHVGDSLVIRVMIANLPALQADVLATLVAAEPDMVVVGAEDAHPLAHLADHSPDVVLVPPGLGDDGGLTLARLGATSGIGVLALDLTHGSILRVLVPDDQLWSAGVVDAIRSAAPHRTARGRPGPQAPNASTPNAAPG